MSIDERFCGQAEKLRKWWDSDCKTFIACEATPAMASAYWQFYPYLYDLCSSDPDDREIYLAKQSLCAVHRHAVQFLMKLAESNQIDSQPLWSGLLACERLVNRKQQRQGPFATFPECYRDVELPADERQAIDDGDATFMRLVAKLDIELPPTGVQSGESIDLRALQVFVVHRDWTKKQIADAVKCHPKSLTAERCPQFNAAWKAWKAKEGAGIPRGAKTADGNIEAWDEG